MGFVDFLGLGRSRLRPIQLGRLCSRPKPRREALQLEALEVRVVLATTTFAQFIHIGESPQVFAYTNNDGASASLNTLPGGDAILLSFDPRFAPGLTGPLTAHLFLNSETATANIAPQGSDNLTRDHFAAADNTIQIVLDTPVDGKSNFLTVMYSDILSGRLGSHEASLRASDAASGVPPDTVTFTSDFINFTGTINHGFSLSFSSVDTNDDGNGLEQGDGGFFKSFTAAATGTFDTNFSGAISGTKFQDTNGNGVRDPGEPGLQGWTILLDSLDGTTHLSTVTDVNGNYSFTDLNPGVYRVREQGQAGWVQITVNPGDVTVLSGSNAMGVDFGNFQLGSIAGQKFQDTNGDGLREPGEPGLQGFTIDLDSLDGVTHLTTVTDANGNFSFMNLLPGTYRVREENRPGYVQTTVNPGDVSILSGSRVSGVDFGNFQLGSIAGQKFVDAVAVAILELLAGDGAELEVAEVDATDPRATQNADVAGIHRGLHITGPVFFPHAIRSREQIHETEIAVGIGNRGQVRHPVQGIQIDREALQAWLAGFAQTVAVGVLELLAGDGPELKIAEVHPHGIGPAQDRDIAGVDRDLYPASLALFTDAVHPRIEIREAVVAIDIGHRAQVRRSIQGIQQDGPTLEARFAGIAHAIAIGVLELGARDGP